jgi:hypothetical protein
MSQSRVFAFADPDSYRIAFRAAEVNMLVKSNGAFHAELTQIDLNRLWMQRGSDSLPRIVRTQIDVKRAPILFFADENQASMQVGGEEDHPARSSSTVRARRPISRPRHHSAGHRCR